MRHVKVYIGGQWIEPEAYEIDTTTPVDVLAYYKLDGKDHFLALVQQGVNMLCPKCQHELTKKDGTGEGVKECKACGSSWFILQCREGKEIESQHSKIDKAQQQMRLNRLGR